MTQYLKVRGFAAPYNVANCYNETMLPGCFDSVLNKVPLKMRTMHHDNAGTWDKLWCDATGLWCEGTVTHPGAIAAVKAGLYHEMSINYSDFPKGERERVMTDIRAADTLERLRPNMPDFLAWAYVHHMEHTGKLSIVHDKTVAWCRLAEISLVDAGAFERTHFAIVGEG